MVNDFVIFKSNSKRLTLLIKYKNVLKTILRHLNNIIIVYKITRNLYK